MAARSCGWVDTKTIYNDASIIYNQGSEPSRALALVASARHLVPVGHSRGRKRGRDSDVVSRCPGVTQFCRLLALATAPQHPSLDRGVVQVEFSRDDDLVRNGRGTVRASEPQLAKDLTVSIADG